MPGGRSRFHAVIIASAALAAFWSGLDAPFILDDRAVFQNPQVRGLWPPQRFLEREGADSTLSNRPVLSAGFAATYALFGLDPRGHRAVNIAIHAAAALFLYGIVRRTLSGPVLGARFGGTAGATALVAALFWTVHPLQAESVTYVVQRAESQMGLFYLASLYGLIRGAGSPRRAAWLAFAWGAAALGIGSKEVALTLPATLLVYDRIFLARAWGALGTRAAFHLAVAAVAVAGGVYVFGGHHAETSREIVRTGMVSPAAYLFTQGEVLLHYLRLALVPAGLRFDPGWPLAGSWREVWPGLAAAAAAVTATGWLVLRGRPAGFLGAWFFLILAPTSSIVPLLDVAFEHRMYLPLAAVAAGLAVAGGEALRLLPERSRRPAAWAGGAAILSLLAIQTVSRNFLFWRAEWIWGRTVRENPFHYRAHGGMAMGLAERDRFERAERGLRRALRLNPAYANGWSNLGAVLVSRNRPEEALAVLEKALALERNPGAAHANRAAAFLALGDLGRAREEGRRAIACDPAAAVPHYNIGMTWLLEGRMPEAEESFRRALALNPRHFGVRWNLAVVLSRTGREDEALGHLEAAATLRPGSPDARAGLGGALLSRDPVEAERHLRAAVGIDPRHAPARMHLGTLLAERGSPASLREALVHLDAALELRPDDRELRRARDEAAGRLARHPE